MILREPSEIGAIKFWVPCVPIAQPRQRHTKQGHNYTPTRHPVNAFKAAIQLALRQAYTGRPLEGPVELWITFVLPRARALHWKTKPMPRIPHTKKPDKENMVKAVLDALNGLAFVDDCQVWRTVEQKVIAGAEEPPGVLLEIRAQGADSP